MCSLPLAGGLEVANGGRALSGPTRTSPKFDPSIGQSGCVVPLRHATMVRRSGQTRVDTRGLDTSALWRCPKIAIWFEILRQLDNKHQCNFLTSFSLLFLQFPHLAYRTSVHKILLCMVSLNVQFS
jgi:hypothetical protein